MSVQDDHPTAVQLGGQTPWTPVELTDPALARDDAPRVVARLRGAQHGHAMLSRLAIGDQSALTESGIITRHAYDSQAHEWGLGVHAQSGTYYLVTGGPNMVAWGHPALQGLDGVAHSHPRHVVNGAVLQENGLTPVVATALNEWRGGLYAKMPIGLMPGDLWALFPSNQDLVASYATAHAVAEPVYLPWRIGTDGWLSAATGPTLVAEFGPVRAALRADAAKVVKESAFDPHNEIQLKAVEGKCLQYLYGPVTFRAGDAVLCTGVLQVDPLKGAKGRDPQNAWFRAQTPDGLLDRGQVLGFIRSTM